MKITPAILIGIVALLLGFFIHSATSRTESSTPDQTPAPSQASSRILTITSHRLTLDRVLEIPDSTNRWLQTVAILEKAELQDMLGIAQSVGFVDDELLKLVAQRWLELDPQHFFETTLAEIKSKPSGESTSFDCFDCMEIIGKEWPKLDFKAALTAFSQPDPGWHLEEVQTDLVTHLSKTDLDKALEICLRLGFDFSNVAESSLRQKAQTKPTSTAQLLFKHFNTADDPPLNSWVAGGDLIKILAETWAKSDPLQALTFANLHQNDQGKYLRTKIIETWLMNDRLAASIWLEEQPPGVQEKHRPAFIKSWATEDPQSALSWCLENLPDPEIRMETARSLFDGAISKDIAEAAALIPELDDHNLKSIAVSKITEEWFKPDKNFEIQPAAIDWLRSLDDSSTAQAVMKGAMESWAKTDPDSMKSYLEEERAFDYPAEAYQQVATALTNRNPIEALAWSAGLGEHSQSALSTASQIWLTKRPEAAINWLRSAPAQPAAEAALKTYIAGEIKYPDNLLLQKLGAENKAWLEAKFGK